MSQDESLINLDINDDNRDEVYKSLVELDTRARQYVQSQETAFIPERGYRALKKAFKQYSITGELVIPTTNFLGKIKARSQIAIEEESLYVTFGGEKPNLIDYYNSRVVYWMKYYNK